MQWLGLQELQKDWRDACGAKGLQAMRIQFQHLGANILAREILTTYEKPLKWRNCNCYD